MFKFWKLKKQNQQKNEEPENYSIDEIERITRKSIEEKEQSLRKEQEMYLQEIERNIYKLAQEGKSHFITRSRSCYDEYITRSFLQEIADLYAKKGYETTIVQPDKHNPDYAWVLIEWGEDKKRARR